MSSIVTGLPPVERIRGELCKRSLARFVKEAWHVLEPGAELVWNWHLDAICEHLQAVTDGRIKRLLINVPPGHMKSMLVNVFWPAWVWLHKPTWRAWFASYAADLSIRDSTKCRDLVVSDWYQAAFAPDWSFAPDQNAKSYLKNTAKGERLALSLKGKGTGLRGDAGVFDDPLNADKGGYTAEALQEVIDWWDGRMSSRLNDLKTGAFVGIMQRLHERDLVGHLMSKKGERWELLCLPTEFEPDRRCKTSLGFEDPRTEPGELLFPARFPKEAIEQAKIDLGPDFDAQHQQRPSSVAGGIFKLKDFRFYYEFDAAPPSPHVSRLDDGTVHEHIQVERPRYMELEAMSWDLAFKKSESTDFVAGHVYGKYGVDIFLLDRFHDRVDFAESLEAFALQCAKWPNATAKYVEDKANGPALMSMLGDRITGIEPVEPEGGKVARAQAAAPIFRSGHVYFPHPSDAPWVLDVIKEMTTFPRGTHDDDVDACTQAINKLRIENNWLEALARS